ncbi:hypothetical protein ACOMICROBIO_NCLOACGD_04464 [Vibrio sp. B1ASS3]|nr:hypothetical protein ACOMICROBIO_NCLOACGD_04464 [Vibrio sp. B1ASS3]CAE6952903.1 hypothetical protein ACOMICROBIO_NCLOACGD_04464 [Vibrio sp. B1ASS3]
MAYIVKPLTFCTLPLQYSTWLDYWKAKKQMDLGACSVIQCVGSATSAVQVRSLGRETTSIVPLCNLCESAILSNRTLKVNGLYLLDTTGDKSIDANG